MGDKKSSLMNIYVLPIDIGARWAAEAGTDLVLSFLAFNKALSFERCLLGADDDADEADTRSGLLIVDPSVDDIDEERRRF